jgi:hypothetical protein
MKRAETAFWNLGNNAKVHYLVWKEKKKLPIVLINNDSFLSFYFLFMIRALGTFKKQAFYPRLQETSILSQAPGHYVWQTNVSTLIIQEPWVFMYIFTAHCGFFRSTPPRLTTQNIFEDLQKSFKLIEFLVQRMSTKPHKQIFGRFPFLKRKIRSFHLYLKVFLGW